MKVVLTGPECSGKTTLATQLAEHFGVSIAPEPARGHLQSQQVYQPSDLLQLTAVQRRLEVKEPVRFFYFWLQHYEMEKARMGSFFILDLQVT